MVLNGLLSLISDIMKDHLSRGGTILNVLGPHTSIINPDNTPQDLHISQSYKGIRHYTGPHIVSSSQIVILIKHQLSQPVGAASLLSVSVYLNLTCTELSVNLFHLAECFLKVLPGHSMAEGQCLLWMEHALLTKSVLHGPLRASLGYRLKCLGLWFHFLWGLILKD